MQNQYYQQNGAYYTLQGGQPNFNLGQSIINRLRSGNLASSQGTYFGGSGGQSNLPSYAGNGPLGGPRDVGSYQRSLDEAAARANNYGQYRDEANTYAAGMRQSRIDAINTTFAPRIAREAQAGENRMSRVAALNFKQGIVGSGVDTTKSGEQKSLNEAALRSIEDEKATSINEAYGWADQLSRQRAEDTFGAATRGAEANVAAEKNKYETAVKSLEFFGKGGTTLEQLKTADPDTYNNLKSVGGLTDLQIAAIMNANSPAPSNVDTRIESGYIISSYFDPQTKKFVHYTEKLDIPSDTDTKNIEVITGKNGLIYAYDKANNRVVNTFGERSPESDSSYKADVSSAISKLNQQINQPGVIGSDGKLSPSNYSKARRQWLDAGLLLKDFEDNFNQYINYSDVGSYYTAPAKSGSNQFIFQ